MPAIETCRRCSASRAGFSLAELMVVIVIIGLLATVVVQNVMQHPVQVARPRSPTSRSPSICSALDNFAIENGGKYPECLEVLVTPDENGHHLLKDQTRSRSIPGRTSTSTSRRSGRTGPYRVISYGKDGKPGGEGDDADIDNFTIRERQVSRPWAPAARCARQAAAGFSADRDLTWSC